MEKEQVQYTLDPKLRRKGMMNSAILALQFLVTTVITFNDGNMLFAAIGFLATIGTINDALTFVYANKEKQDA